MCYCEVRTLQTKSTMYKQCEQNFRDFVKKVLVIKLDPQRFWQINVPGFNVLQKLPTFKITLHYSVQHLVFIKY